MVDGEGGGWLRMVAQGPLLLMYRAIYPGERVIEVAKRGGKKAMKSR